MNLSFSLKYNIQLSDTFFFQVFLGMAWSCCVSYSKSDGLWSIVFGSTDINLIGTLKRTEYGKRV